MKNQPLKTTVFLVTAACFLSFFVFGFTDNLKGPTLPSMIRELHIDYPFVHQMIAAGYTGRKGKGGFYRLDPASKDKAKQAMTLNPDTFNESQYKAAAK